MIQWRKSCLKRTFFFFMTEMQRQTLAHNLNTVYITVIQCVYAQVHNAIVQCIAT